MQAGQSYCGLAELYVVQYQISLASATPAFSSYQISQARGGGLGVQTSVVVDGARVCHGSRCGS